MNPPPEPCEANPGRGPTLRVEYEHDGERREEDFDAVDGLEHVLREAGFAVDRHPTWLELEGGLRVLPQWASYESEDGDVRTTTTIEVSLPGRIPPGVFEYQHARGDGVVQSMASGFEGWLFTDLPAFLDALRDEPEVCTCIGMDVPLASGGEVRRRVVLGPPLHAAQKQSDADADHPFCPCCLITKSWETFRPLIQGDRFVAVRLYAARAGDGTTVADCRVNGEDWPAGRDALQTYATTWPDRGVEWRKQLVVMMTLPAD